MIAYLIDKDFTISKVEGSIKEILHKEIVWACLGYNEDNDIWYDDFGLSKGNIVLAKVGRHPRVPLPVYIMGGDGELSCDPWIPMEEVEFERW